MEHDFPVEGVIFQAQVDEAEGSLELVVVEVLPVFEEDGESNQREANDPDEDNWQSKSVGILLLLSCPALQAHVHSQVAISIPKDVNAVVDGHRNGGNGG